MIGLIPLKLQVDRIKIVRVLVLAELKNVVWRKTRSRLRDKGLIDRLKKGDSCEFKKKSHRMF